MTYSPKTVVAKRAADSLRLAQDGRAEHARIVEALQGRSAPPATEQRLKDIEQEVRSADADALQAAESVATWDEADAARSSLDAIMNRANTPEVTSSLIDVDAVRSLPVGGTVEARGLAVGTAGSGAELATGLMADRIHLGLQPLAPAQAVIPRLPVVGAGSSVLIPVEVVPESVDTFAEAATITEDGTDFGQVEVSWHKFARLAKVSSELVQDTSYNIGAFVENSLLRGLARKVESSVLVGTGLGTNPRGLFTAGWDITETAAAALGVLDLEDIFAAAARVIVNGGTPTHAIINPAKAMEMLAVKRADGTGPTNVRLVESLAKFEEVTGLKPVLSPAAPATKALVGDFTPASAHALWLVRQDPTILASRDFAFDTDQVTFRLTYRANLTVLSPGAFQIITGA